MEVQNQQTFSLFLNAPGAIAFYQGPQLKLTFMNRAGEIFFGKENCIGRSFDEVFSELKNQKFRDLHFVALQQKEGLRERHLLLHGPTASGSENRYIDLLIEQTCNAEGEVEGIVAHYNDITKQIRARELNDSSASFLAESSEVLGQSLDYLATLKTLARLAVPRMADWCLISVRERDHEEPKEIAMAHTDPTKVVWLEEFRTKYPPDWSARRGVPEVIRSGRPELYEYILEEALQLSARDERHLQLLHELGMKSVMIVPLKYEDKTIGAILFIAAESGRHYGVADLEVAEELARRAGRAVGHALKYRQGQDDIRARDEFLSIASHELKTPLTPLKIQVQTLKRFLDRGEWDKVAAEKLRSIAAASDRQIGNLVRLIEDLLDVSRFSSDQFELHLEDFDLRDLIHEVLERYAPQLQTAGCAIDVQSPEPLRGRWDRIRIEQVFVNLLTNAMKYAAQKPLFIGVFEKMKRAVLIVRDQGRGISEADQARIFDRFERGSAEAGSTGLGLGLFIARQIVEAHGGTLRVESQLGLGSTFTVDLPLP